MEFAVVKLAQIGSGVALQSLENVYSHAVHCVLLPKANVAVAVLENIDAIAIANTVKALSGIAIEIKETIFLFDFLVWMGDWLHLSFICRKVSTSLSMVMWV